ncbi:MAG: alpha/beta fold hydrolase [Pirellulaceae bacterium]
MGRRQIPLGYLKILTTPTTPLLLVVLVLCAGCSNSRWATVRKTPKNPLEGPLQLVSWEGPTVTEETRLVLRTYDLEQYASKDYSKGLDGLAEEIKKNPSANKAYAFAEMSYIAAKRSEAANHKAIALERYAGSVAHAHEYLFSEEFANDDGAYDPRFRRACDLYNGSLEGALRLVKAQGKLVPGTAYRIKTPQHDFQFSLKTTGRWSDDDFQEFHFASDFEIKGLKNQHRRYGLGVPLIAVCNDENRDQLQRKYFPPKLTFALTAFLNVSDTPLVDPETGDKVHHCEITLYDPLEIDHVTVQDKPVPLEADVSTPLAYLLDSNTMASTTLATLGLLNPGETQKMQGVYMLEPYDPKKIPVVMVHGLWSSPMTWLEMFNDLRAQPEIQKDYQFWFYLYPTGQPFWTSATQFRQDLAEMRAELDPQNQAVALDQMVLVGHSMGGLVSRMQTIESGDEFWNLVTDKPPEQLTGDPEDREELINSLYFHPNPSIQRVVTMGTPHHGSDFANDFTRWLGRSLIVLPNFLADRKTRLIEQNPGYFNDTDLLRIATSVDSLSPESPMLSRIIEAPKAPWVKYHTVIGVVDQDTWLGYFSGKSDGVVEFESAQLKEAKSELVVTSDHNAVHRHPRSVLEVRRILLEHVAELREEYQAALDEAEIEPQPLADASNESPEDVQPASFEAPVETDQAKLSRFSQPEPRTTESDPMSKTSIYSQAP